MARDVKGGEWTRSGTVAERLAKAKKAGLSERAARAKATHKSMTKSIYKNSGIAEMRVKDIVGGEGTPARFPVDVIVRKSGRTIGIEVKSIQSNSNDKITMHPPSLARKFKWQTKNKAELHTVVVDMKSGTMLHRESAGSFRLHTMTVVKNNAHLRRLMGIQ